ncbi:MAG: nucleoside deaminase [Eubacteriaceae bacterium]
MKKKRLSFQDYIKEAIKEGEKALLEGEVPIGAVLVKDGEIVAKAHNQKEGLCDPTAHAEILVIREGAKKLGRWRLEDCCLFVTAEPCPMCMGAIIQARIPKLIYGTPEKKFGGVESTVSLGKHPMLPSGMEIYSGFLEKECQELLTVFFAKKR